MMFGTAAALSTSPTDASATRESLETCNVSVYVPAASEPAAMFAWSETPKSRTLLSVPRQGDPAESTQPHASVTPVASPVAGSRERDWKESAIVVEYVPEAAEPSNKPMPATSGGSGTDTVNVS